MIVEHPKLVLPEEFHCALVGNDSKQGRAVYSIEGILEVLMTEEGWTLEESIEHFDHNIECAYLGEMTPIYIWTEGIEEWLEES